jgi:hypothetical protein
MMEAVIIVLSIVAAAGWTAFMWACTRFDDAGGKDRRHDDHPDYWFERYVETHRELQSLRAQIAPFDHDGDGKIGGSKPRGKG